MTEYDDIERSLTREFAKVGASAHPRADAWERLMDRPDFPRHAQLTVVAEATPLARDDDVPDPRDPFDMDELTSSDEQPWGRRRWPILGVACGLIVVALGGLVLSDAMGDDSDAPVQGSTMELRGADGDADAIAAFAAVTAAYDAYNRGDLEGWLTARAAPQIDLNVEALRRMASEVAAGAQYDVEYCDYGGSGEWARVGHEGFGPVYGQLFECTATLTDALTAAAGIDSKEQIRWLVVHGRVADASSVTDSSELRQSFEYQFAGWLAREHPGTFVRPLPDGSQTYISAEDMPEALALLDDFIAADDRWPVGDD